MVLAIVIIVIIAIIVPITTYIIISGQDSNGGSSGNGDSGNGGYTIKPSVGVENPSEKSYGWTITISSVSGGTFKLEDAKFRLIDDANFRIEGDRDVTEVNPAAFSKGASKVYVIPSGIAAVTNAAGNTISASDNPQDYKNCSFAFIDQDNDGKVTAGDTIFIYKDNDNDGSDEVLSGYVFELLYKDEMVIHKTL